VGVFFVLFQAVVSLVGGAVTAAIGGRAARFAVPLLAIAPAVAGLYGAVTYGRDFMAVVMLTVMTPCCLLGGAVVRWRARKRESVPST